MAAVNKVLGVNEEKVLALASGSQGWLTNISIHSLKQNDTVWIISDKGLGDINALNCVFVSI